MKKIKIGIAFLVIIAALFAFSSCAVIDFAYQAIGKEPDNADQVFRFIDNKMSTIDSYDVKGDLDLAANVSGNYIVSASKNKQTFSGMTSGNYYHYSETSTIPQGSAADMTIVRYGYYDGTAFVYADGLNGSTIPFTGCSEMAFDEYFDYIRAYDENDAIISVVFPSVLDCRKKSYTHEEDGSWTVSFSEYNPGGLLSILEDTGFDGELFDDEVEDVEIKYFADSEFRCTEMQVRYVFSKTEGKNAPSLYMVLEYSNYNNVVLNTEKLNKENYNEFSDLTLITKLEDKLVEARNEKKNTVSLEISNRFSVQNTPYEGVIRKSVSYGEENEKFYFDYGSPDSDIADVYYEDGVLQYKSAGGVAHDSLFETVVRQTEINEYMAKEVLESLIFLDFNIYRIKAIEEVSEDQYKVTLNAPDIGSLNGLILYQGVDVTGGEIEMEFKLKDGALMSIGLDATLNCMFRSGSVVLGGVSLTVTGFADYNVPYHKMWHSSL